MILILAKMGIALVFVIVCVVAGAVFGTAFLEDDI